MESEVIANWLHDTLTSDAALTAMLTTGGGLNGVYDSEAPAGAGFPRIVFQEQSATMPVRVMPAAVIMGRSVWLVRATTTGRSYAPLIPIAKRIRDLLEGATAEREDGAIVSCYWRESFRMPEGSGNASYRHLGDLWDIQSQSEGD